MKYVIAYDLGTGGIKSSVFDQEGNSICADFIEYDTYYDRPGFQEQNPDDWWEGVVSATKNLFVKAQINKEDILAIGISGHSLGVVAVDEDCRLLVNRTPIWSDARASKQAKAFFADVDRRGWYEKTGNGFPDYLYSVFKIMWYQENDPELYRATYKFIGTKDYINCLLTGKIVTDFSYASGSGVYDLKNHEYYDAYIHAAGIDKNKLPKIVDSSAIIGKLSSRAAQLLGLTTDTVVVSGGVDNACMALGANCRENGQSYTSLGTSAWIAVSNQEPILNYDKKTYVFAHCLKGKYVSATCIFSAGRSLKWAKDTLCQNLLREADALKKSVYVSMDTLASDSPVGSNGLLFNPSLSGGSSLDKSPNIRGSYLGIDLMQSQGDIVRATMEGVALNLRLALDSLRENTEISAEMLLVGGGSNSELWRQIFADVYEMRIIQTNVGQDAGSLGAAALALVGCGLWQSYDEINRLHNLLEKKEPIVKNVLQYRQLRCLFEEIAVFTGYIGDKMKAFRDTP